MKTFHKLLRSFVLLFALLLTACAAQQPVRPQKLVDHTFEFDARVDSKDSEVLAFKYGAGGTPQRQSPFWNDQTDARQATGTSGLMPVGDTLYVKWRTRSTNEVFEDLVNLKPLLPADMSRQRIYFMVQGKQLFVYRIEPVQRPKEWPVVGPRKFQYEKAHQIYPAFNK